MIRKHTWETGLNLIIRVTNCNNVGIHSEQQKQRNCLTMQKPVNCNLAKRIYRVLSTNSLASIKIRILFFISVRTCQSHIRLYG